MIFHAWQMTVVVIRTVHFGILMSLGKDCFTHVFQEPNATDIAVFWEKQRHMSWTFCPDVLSNGQFELQM